MIREETSISLMQVGDVMIEPDYSKHGPITRIEPSNKISGGVFVMFEDDTAFHWHDAPAVVEREEETETLRVLVSDLLPGDTVINPSHYSSYGKITDVRPSEKKGRALTQVTWDDNVETWNSDETLTVSRPVAPLVDPRPPYWDYLPTKHLQKRDEMDGIGTITDVQPDMSQPSSYFLTVPGIFNKRSVPATRTWYVHRPGAVTQPDPNLGLSPQEIKEELLAYLRSTGAVPDPEQEPAEKAGGLAELLRKHTDREISRSEIATPAPATADGDTPAEGEPAMTELTDDVIARIAELEATAPKRSTKEKEQAEALHALETLGGKTFAEEDVIFAGKKIILPENLTLVEAVKFLSGKITEDEQTVDFSRTFNFRPWDGAYATREAIRKAFGMMRQVPVQTMFGPIPPRLISIKTDVGEETQVPWGDITLPQLPGLTLSTDSTRHPEFGLIYQIVAEGPRKYRFAVEGLFNLIENELQQNSIYRGKVFDGQEAPEFLDLSGVDPAKVVYSQEVMEHLDANIWSLLRHSDEMRTLGVPLKRAVLFEGPYGTGKTLGAYLTAKVAKENGWTFVYVRPGRDDFERAMATARLYQPSVIFFEDVDTTTSPEGGEDHVSKMLDLFDGIQSKGTEIIAVLTTNHVDAIHKGMLRPGRLDAIIHIGALDAAGVQKLIEVSVPAGNLADEIEWDRVAVAMTGFMPAFVKEATDRAVRYSLARNNGKLAPLTTDDLVFSADGLRPQLDLMDAAPEYAVSEPLGAAFAAVIDQRVEKAINSTALRNKNGDTVLAVESDKVNS